MNPMCWTDDLLRIYHIETLSTYQHPSPEVNFFKEQWQTTVLLQLLQSGAERRQRLAKEPQITSSEHEMLQNEISEICDFTQSIKSSRDFATSKLEVAVTRIVARKAMNFSKEDSWMSRWYRTNEMYNV